MSFMVTALAGTGKTFTLVNGVQCLKRQLSKDIVPSNEQQIIWDELSLYPQPESICFAAFTVSAKDEIKNRLCNSTYCNVTTMHGMGFQTIRNEIGMSGSRVKLDVHKTDKLLEIVHNGTSIYVLRKAMPGYPAAVKRLVQLSKYMILTNPSDNDLITLAGQYDVTLGSNADQIFSSVRKILLLAQKDCHQIDYDDMIWLPIVLGMSIRKYDALFVDEGQDLNRCQQQLALRAASEMFIAGDKHQAIYGFAGADTKSMSTMYDSLGYPACKVFPLTVTRRCSHAVVAEAQRIVPEFTAHARNSKGDVRVESTYDSAIPGDMILCRINAPLLREAFKMIAKGIAVEMLGRKIGENLIYLIRMLKPVDINDLKYKLDKYKENELIRLRKRKRWSAAAEIAIIDKCKCLQIFCQHSDSIEYLISSIKSLFSSNKKKTIRLSSIHQAKGLEARNIFILRPDLLPHPLATTPWQKEQEDNLEYVAITRAIDTLTWVESTDI